jgi:hypothetical protein
MLLVLVSCKSFYKASTINPSANKTQSIDSLQALNRYFILRSSGQAYFMNGLQLSQDRRTLTATLDTLPPQHQMYLTKSRNGNMHYKKSNPQDLAVLSEVHLYAPAVKASMGETIMLPLDQVQKIEVIEHDKKRTTNSYVIGAIGATLGAFAVAMIIVAATKSSCPFVSANDGTGFTLQGEIYGGAIYPQMARHDYLPLKMAPLQDGSLQLKISNELKEVQYTDFANLLVIKHEPSVRILTNESGELYGVRSPQSPVSALLNNRRDVRPSLLQEGDHAITYMDDTTTLDASNNINLVFTKERGASKAKLVLTLKNSYWLDQLYGELAYGFGRQYPKYMKKQSKKPVKELVQWTKEQQIPLVVSVQTAKGWEKLTELTTVGPLANRSIVVPVDMTGIRSDSVNIRVVGGFMFWELDYAGLDFSSGDAYTVECLSPASATDETGKDVLEVLQKEDGQYLEQPLIGNVATLVYKPDAPQEATKRYTYILHTKGYYQHLRNFTHRPNVSFLKQFKNPNAFPQYGKQRYRQVEQESLRMMAATPKQ